MSATKKIPVEQKAGDPLGERTIDSPPQRRRFEQQLAASRRRCIGHERGNLAQRKTIAHRLGFRSTTRMASNKWTGSPSRFDIAMGVLRRQCAPATLEYSEPKSPAVITMIPPGSR